MMKSRINLSIHFEKRFDLAALTALSILVIILVVFFGVQELVSAASYQPESPPALPGLQRFYYLTDAYYNGAQADGSDGDGGGVCAPGYHFASIWEIQDTSNLKYNATLGKTQDDSAQGPPNWFSGWVRTGNISTSFYGGGSNCYGWTSDGVTHYGTAVWLPKDWSGGLKRIPYTAGAYGCDSTLPVWCVADHVGIRVYLPLVIR